MILAHGLADGSMLLQVRITEKELFARDPWEMAREGYYLVGPPQAGTVEKCQRLTGVQAAALLEASRVEVL